MVHVLAPRPPVPGLPIFFNVDGAVGRNGQDDYDDVLLVQYFLSIIGKNPAPGSQLTELAAIPVTGRMNSQTLAGIEAVQRASRITPDGRVSVAKGYKYGANFYTIVNLNFSVRTRFRRQWPNLEELPECPPHLNMAGRRALAGTG